MNALKVFRACLGFVALLVLLGLNIPISLSIVSAQSCSIEFFNLSSGSPVSLGTHVTLHGKGNCGTARFEINGQPRAEIGAPEQTETWKTEEFGAGTYNVCFVLRGDGGWENAARQCQSITVQGSSSSSTSPTSDFTCDQTFYNDLVAHFLQHVPPAPAYLDLNGDGVLDLSDYSICASHWNPGGGGNPQSPPNNGNSESGGSTENTVPQRGGMNIQAYCVSIGYTGTTYGADAYSWVCTKDGSQPQPIDVDGVCRQNHGNALPYAGLGNTNDVFSWYCASTPQGRPGSGDPNPSSNNGGGSNNQGNSSNIPIADDDTTPPSGIPSNLCPGAPESYMSGATKGQSTNGGDPLRVRDNPGTGGQVIGHLQNGQEFLMTGSPQCADGYTWWQINADGLIGWVAERTTTSWFIKPVEVSSPIVLSPTPVVSSPILKKLANDTVQDIEVAEDGTSDGLLNYNILATYDTINGAYRIRTITIPYYAEPYALELFCITQLTVVIKDQSNNILLRKDTISFFSYNSEEKTLDIAPFATVGSSGNISIQIGWRCGLDTQIEKEYEDQVLSNSVLPKQESLTHSVSEMNIP